MRKDSLDYHVHNYMEDIVTTIIVGLEKSDNNLCYCPRCLKDISALVLNELKPQYIKIETELDKLDSALVTKIRNLVIDAATKVNENPHHDDHTQHDNTHLENLSEQLVNKVLQDIFQGKDVPKIDEEMIPLVASMVLNQVKPRYAVTDRGGAYMRLAELEHQFLPGTIAVVYNVLNQINELE